MLSSLLNSALTTIVVDVIGIIAIILIGAFLVALVADIFLFVFDKDSSGIFFRRHPKEKAAKKEKVVVEKNATVEPLVLEKNATVTPLLSLSEERRSASHDDEFQAIDFNRAVEEQKMLQGKSKVSSDKLFVSEGTNNFADIEDEEDEEDEDDITKIIEEVQKQALKEIQDEDSAKSKEKVKLIKEDPVFVVEEEQKTAKQSENIPTRRIATPKIIYKKIEQEVEKKPEPKPEPKVEKIVEVKPEVQQNTNNENYVLNEIRKIRDEIFDLRLSIFNEMYASKDGKVTKTRKNQIEELEEDIIEKMQTINSMYAVNTALLANQKEQPEPVKEIVKEYVEDTSKIKELEEEKLALREKSTTLEEEKIALKEKSSNLKEENELLLQEKLVLRSESETLKEEKEKLQKEVQSLKSTVGSVIRPIYSKTYYEQRLEDLEEELKDAQKELRLNSREFNPLKRIKKSFDRDSVKLRRKEAIVAKQKVSIYGVNNINNIDPEKVAKLEEEVEALRKLKESVYHCEQVLKQNKDRYPVLEKTNRIITKHIATITNDIEQTQKSLAWFAENADDENAKK